MWKKIYLTWLVFLTISVTENSIINGQPILSNRIIPTNEVYKQLKPEIIEQISENDVVTEGELAEYFRTHFSEYFFFDYKNVDERFADYSALYGGENSHRSRANDHISKFQDSTQWLLPFNYLNGDPVNSYALRHLARQHKMVDIAYLYFYENKNEKYINYFTKQMRSLNMALAHKQFETIKDGNGVYESFRSGYRILNWLQIHNLFLGEEAYSDNNQVYTIATLLQHAAHLYENNKKFHPGNHQTRGMSALAMLSILLKDFKDADVWYEHSMAILGEHLDKEINSDGFQFERSVHYHISDIANYFYVYQLAKLGNVDISADWENKLRTLFVTLTKIAYPDKSAPVLQDDTDKPWAEKNSISGTLTLGYLLFNDPEMGYFADTKVKSNMYWFLRKNQLESLQNTETKEPIYKSLHFPETGYYIMREGWNAKNKMMIISAGLDADKPDHQHGDMLGIQAMANEKVILPNYQVRYSLEDYQYFKNSLVKNVALVDDQLQGKKWTGNKGGSGFGKFKELPVPHIHAWETNDTYDLFVGSHNGFEEAGVKYSRQVIYIKDGFWIVKDNFYSDSEHTYKQVWQGHYTSAKPSLIRSVFDDASGLDSLQINNVDDVLNKGTQGKQATIVNKKISGDYSFITILYPFSTYDTCLESENPELIKDWKVNNTQLNSNADKSLSKNNTYFLFSVNSIEVNQQKMNLDDKADIIVTEKNQQIYITNIGDSLVTIEYSLPRKKKLYQIQLKPGEERNISIKRK